MLTTSQAMATISFSFTWARIALASLGSILFAAFILPFLIRRICRARIFATRVALETKIVRIGAQLFVALPGNQEIIFQAQAAAARPVNSRLDWQPHSRRRRPC